MNTKLILTGIVFSTSLLASAMPALAAPRDASISARERLKMGVKSGRASIGSGTIAAISGTTLTVTGKDGKTYTVTTDSTTRLLRRYGGKASLSEMIVGDVVSVVGKYTDDTQTTVAAKLVRDMSVQKRNGTFMGTVTVLTSTGFTMSTPRGSQTVTVISTTKYMNRRNQAVTQADVKVGDKVRVKGLWDSKLNTITEVTAVKDFSLKPTGTVTPTPTPAQ